MSSKFRNFLTNFNKNLINICYNEAIFTQKHMKFEPKHLGKWVATKNEKVIATAKTLKLLMTKVQKKGYKKGVRYTPLSKELIWI